MFLHHGLFPCIVCTCVVHELTKVKPASAGVVERGGEAERVRTQLEARMQTVHVLAVPLNVAWFSMYIHSVFVVDRL
jgi:hypothetical protein